MKTLNELWASERDEFTNTVDVELSEPIDGSPVREEFMERFHIHGKMPKNGGTVYFGWKIKNTEKAKFWSAFGNEKVADVFAKSRSVL